MYRKLEGQGECGTESRSWLHTCEHLEDLEGGDADGDKLGCPPAGSPHCIVAVHDRMDHVVDSTEPTTCGEGSWYSEYFY